MKHYTVTTRVNGEVIASQPIGDPFIRTTVTVSTRDLLRALLRCRRLTVEINVTGDRHATFHVMQPILLVPEVDPADRIQGGEAAHA